LSSIFKKIIVDGVNIFAVVFESFLIIFCEFIVILVVVDGVVGFPYP